MLITMALIPTLDVHRVMRSRSMLHEHRSDSVRPPYRLSIQLPVADQVCAGHDKQG